MQPDFDLRLSAMMKAQSQVVIPAIDPGNRQALEQAQLVLGSMDVLRNQVNHAHWYEAADLISLCNLAEELAAVQGLDLGAALPEARKQGLQRVSRGDVSLSRLREASHMLRDAVSNVVESVYAHAANDIVHAVTRIVMAHAKEQIGRERAFVAPMKWDGYPDSLQSVEDALRGAPKLHAEAGA